MKNKITTPLFYKPENVKVKEQIDFTYLNENFQSELSKEEVSLFMSEFRKKLGEPHPFDYSVIDKLEDKFGLITAIEDKIADYTLGPGMFISSDDQKLKDFLEKWKEDSHLKFFIRPWFRAALGKGTGYLEVAGLSDIETSEKLKVISTDTMYIKRDKKGNIEAYNQFIGSDMRTINEDDINSITKENVIQLNINQVGNRAYGNGIVYAGISIINDFLNGTTAMHKVLRRKANSPIHAKLGNVEKDDYPTQTEIDAYGKKLQYMSNTTEWVTGPNVEMSVLDFGNVGDKFLGILQFDLKMLSYVFQVPESILGADKGYVGAAEIQDTGFDKLIAAYQEQIGFIIKTKIFDVLLAQEGLSDIKYSIVWGEKSTEEKSKLRDSYQKILSSSTDLSAGLKREYERKISELDDIDFEEVEKFNLQHKDEQDKKEQDVIKQQNILNKQIKPKENMLNIADHIILDGYLKGMAPQEIENELIIKQNIDEKEAFRLVENELNNLDENIELTEWIGEFVQVKKEILEVIKGDSFTDLAAQKRGDLALGKLNKKQVEQLRNVMSDAFENNRGLHDIAKNIEKIGLKDRFINKNGKKVLNISKGKRAFAIARTETVRLRANGSLVGFEKKKLKEVTFTLVSAKPCPQCESLAGSTYKINEAFGIIPVHGMCRCRWDER